MGIVVDDPHYMQWYWLELSLEQTEAEVGRYRYHEEDFSAPTIVDLLEARNLSWKCYVEDLPPDKESKGKLDYDLSKSPADNLENVPPDKPFFPYARKHVLFLAPTT